MIPAEVFHRKVGIFLDMLRTVDRNVTEELSPYAATQTSIKWLIRNVQMGSLKLELLAERGAVGAAPLVVDRVITSVERGLAQITAPEPLTELPPYFTFHVLEQLRDLVRPVGDGVVTIAVQTVNADIVLTGRAEPNLERFLRPVSSHAGSVEGIVQAVAVAGESLRFSVRDRLTGRDIRCKVRRDRGQEVLDAFDGRVVVTGRLRTNAQGDVLSASVERIEAFPDEGSLPGIQDVAGKYDITRGKSVRAHLESLWNAS